MTTVEVLRKAKSLIETVGWCQGTFEAQDKRGRTCGYCIFGAIRSAARNDDPRIPAISALQKVTKELNLAEWNDRRGRTKSTILKALDKAIKAEEKLGEPQAEQEAQV